MCASPRMGSVTTRAGLCLLTAGQRSAGAWSANRRSRRHERADRRARVTRSAPVATLERAAVSGDPLGKLLRDIFEAEPVAGTFVVSTCNRVEVYAEVDKFHAGLSAISDLLARHSGIPLAELTEHLYVHYEDRAVQHLLTVAAGLDSMVVGESQILGQVRQAIALAREQGTLSRALDGLGTLALRTAKRAHAETGIDRAGANLVSVGVGPRGGAS